MKKPGIIMLLPDGRKIIMYEDQPLLQEKGKVILTLLTDDLEPTEKKLIKDVHVWNEQAQACKILGFAD